ncbi:MAG: FtsQ-type POTRA domain-containing protein [Clostridia bacterium]|nr:FtsQ-type POTRA domain-containing protein [Clostridia bacterium]
MKLLRSKRHGMLRGMIVRRPSGMSADARTTHPTSALIALASTQEQERRHTPGVQAPIPSDERFVRQFLRVWTRRLMVLCALGAICLAAAVPLLSLLKVKQISISGQVYYDVQTILEGAGVGVGDELLSCSPGEIRTSLLQKYPYLSTVSVDRTVFGVINISITERTPVWALVLSEDGVALLDASMRVLEIRPKSELDETVCEIECELFLQSDNTEQDNAQPQEIRVGQTYDGNAVAIAKLSALAQAMQTTVFAHPATRIDMSDPYDVKMILKDGTVLMLHECLKPAEQLKEAQFAMQAYYAQSGVTGPLRVEVDDSIRTNIRPLS